MAVSFNKKFASIAGAFLLVVSLVVSGFVIEDRYNNQEHHDKDLANQSKMIDTKFDGFEKQLVMNLKQFQMEQKVSLEAQKKENDYRYYMGMLENIRAQLYKLRQWMRQHPNDQDAKQDYNNLIQKEQAVQQKLNELMSSN